MKHAQLTEDIDKTYNETHFMTIIIHVHMGSHPIQYLLDHVEIFNNNFSRDS